MRDMKHECDCGAVYSNLDALLACQNSNHGVPRDGQREIIDRIARALFLRDRNASWEGAMPITQEAYRDEARGILNG